MKKMVAVLLAACLGLASVAAAEQKPKILITTGGIGGVYYYYGTAVAEILTKYAGVEATAIQTAASVDNLLLVQRRTDPRKNTYYLGIVLPDSAYLAYTGKIEKFAGKPATDVRVLWATYPNILHVVAAPGTRIKSLQDLKGKRVSTAAPGSGTELEAFMVLDAAGVKPAMFSKQERLGAGESGEAMAQGTLDAYFWSGGLPTGSVTELATTMSRQGKKLEFVDLDPKSPVVKGLLAKFPGVMQPGIISKDVYGTATNVHTLEFWNLFVGPKSLPEKYSYAITKALFEHQAELAKAVKAAKDNTLQNAVKFVHGTIPYDPGALRYYKEKGLVR